MAHIKEVILVLLVLGLTGGPALGAVSASEIPEDRIVWDLPSSDAAITGVPDAGPQIKITDFVEQLADACDPNTFCAVAGTFCVVTCALSNPAGSMTHECYLTPDGECRSRCSCSGGVD